MLLLHSKDQQ